MQLVLVFTVSMRKLATERTLAKKGELTLPIYYVYYVGNKRYEHRYHFLLFQCFPISSIFLRLGILLLTQ